MKQSNGKINNKNTQKNTYQQPDRVDERVNKLRYIAACLFSDFAIGIVGFVCMGIAFMIAVSHGNEQTVKGMVYLALGFSLLLVFLINYFINKIIYFYFNHFNEIPKAWMIVSNLCSFVVLIIIYIIMSLA